MKSYIDITSRYLKVQKKRTILTIIGILLSVALITGIGTIIVSVNDKMVRDAIKDHGKYHATFSDLEREQLAKVNGHMLVKKSAIVAQEGFAFINKMEVNSSADIEEPPNRYFNVQAYDKEAQSMLPIFLAEGRLPNNTNEIAVDAWALEYLPEKYTLGSKIKMALGERKDDEGNSITSSHSWSAKETFTQSHEKEYTIVGLLKPRHWSSMNFCANAISYMDNKALQSEGKYQVFVQLKDVNHAKEKGLQILKDTGLMKPNEEYQNVDFNESLLRVLGHSINDEFNAAIWSILAFIVGLVIVSTIAVIYNAFHISVLERISQFGLFRCVGASPQQIRRIVLKEAMTLSLIGIPLGLFCGTLAMKIVFAIIGTIGTELPFGDLQVVLSPIVIIGSAGLGLITVFLSAYGPARQAGNIPPIEAVRNTGKFKKESFKNVRKSRLARLFFGTEGWIAWKNLRRNRKRLNITVFSMMISIVLFITFGSFVEYAFKAEIISENRVTDFSMWHNGDGFTNEDYDSIKRISGVKRVYKYNQQSIQAVIPKNKFNPEFLRLIKEEQYEEIDGLLQLHNNNLICFGNEQLSMLKKHLLEGDIDLQTLKSDSNVILVRNAKLYDEDNNKSVYLKTADFQVGDDIDIQMDDEKRKVKVAAIIEKGILNDEYNQSGGINLVVSEQVFEDLTKKSGYSNLYVDLEKNADRAPMKKFLKEKHEKSSGFNYIDFDESGKEYNKTMTIMSIFLYGFVAVITLIGCLNIINTISTNLILRTRELSMMKAVGMAKGGIKKMVYLESIFYGIIAAILGSIIGVLMSRILFNLVNDIRGFEWSIPWNHMSIAVVGTIGVALLAGYVPLKRINQGVIIENIRMEE